MKYRRKMFYTSNNNLCADIVSAKNALLTTYAHFMALKVYLQGIPMVIVHSRIMM